MKKTLLILLGICCIALAYGQTIGKQVRLSAADVKIESAGVGYIQVNFNGSEYMQKIGEPQLPMLTYRFVVPQEAQINGVNVQVNSRAKLNLDYPIFPAQKPDEIGLRESPINEFAINNGIYQSTQEYPGRQAEIIGDNMQSDYRIITVGIYPVTYKPVSKEIFISSLSMSLNYTVPLAGQTHSLEELPKQTLIRADYAKAVIRSLVDNPESVDLFSPQVNIVRQAKNIQLVDTANRIAPRVVNLLAELIPEYIIITNEALKESFQVLADWKTQLGKPAIIKTVEEIYKSYPGIDKPEQIRNYLIECKKRWGSELFVLIGGNNDIVPAREISGSQSRYWVTDFYYATTGSTWYYSFNKGFDESQMGHDFNVGRAPAGNTEDAVNFINKVISYEKGLFSDKSYVNNFLTALGMLDRAKCVDPATNQPYPDSQQVRQTMGHLDYFTKINGYLNDNLPEKVKSRSKLIIDNHQLTGTVYAYDKDFTKCTYEFNTPAYMPSNKNGLLGDFELTKQNFINQLNTGGYHFIYHNDHSNTKAIGTSSRDKSSDASSTDAAGLNNGKEKLQIMFSTGCDPATFSAPDCFGAEYVNARNGGGVAFIGFSDAGYYGEWNQLSTFLDKLYHKNERNDLAFLYKNVFDNAFGKRR